MTFRLGIDLMIRKGKSIGIYKNRQVQGCEVNACLHLKSTKPKSVLNKVKSGYNDFLDNLCVCVCSLCVSPQPCFPVNIL